MIELRNVTKKYGDTTILENACYTFPETGIVCLMGASGGGKTTLLNLLAGFDTDYEGEIVVGGTAINQMNAAALCSYRRDNIGFVFQNYHLLTGYTVLENVCLASSLSEISEADSKQKAAALLEQLGIGEKQNQKAENLSGGQKQRAAIARALLGDPQILLADEPTGALDRTTSTEIMKLLQEIAQDRLVVVITHDAKICEFADEVIHIKEHQIVSEHPHPQAAQQIKPLVVGAAPKASVFPRAVKNFKVGASAPLLVAVFTPLEEVRSSGSAILRTLILSLPFMGGITLCSTTFQAMGKPLKAFILTISRQGLLYIPLLFLLNHLFGLRGMIYSQPIADLIMLLVSGSFLLKVMYMAASVKRYV